VCQRSNCVLLSPTFLQRLQQDTHALIGDDVSDHLRGFLEHSQQHNGSHAVQIGVGSVEIEERENNHHTTSLSNLGGMTFDV
jgi:hypothetical protein